MVRYHDTIGSLEIRSLLRRYRESEVTPRAVIEAIYDRIDSRGDDAVWISLVDREQALRLADDLGADASSKPLFGIPFAVKDNIDVAGMPTTAACPDFAYVPSVSATVVDSLLEAGAILIGKTNLDQFATGLNGTRSPYGAPSTPFDEDSISGGSSSGSAVAVSAGLVSFSLGTDTAGSGRVPAALTNTVGLKPSRGLVSNYGVVPACASLDCTGIFSLTIADSALVLSLIGGPDAGDPWSRDLPVPSAMVAPVTLEGLRLGIPGARWLDIDEGYLESWKSALDSLVAVGVTLVEIDMAPFFEAGDLLYSGPWLAERRSGIEDFVISHPDSIFPVTRSLLEAGAAVTGTDVFRGLTVLNGLKGEVSPVLDSVDALLTPTTPRTFTKQQMLDDPIVNNSVLGRFTTFGNLLDLAGVALPGALTTGGMPFGLSVLAKAGSDARVIGIASAIEALLGRSLGATDFEPITPDAGAAPAVDAPESLLLAVVGAHLDGMPLNPQLRALGADLVRTTTTAPSYRLFALANTEPAKPGLLRVETGGAEIEVEVYRIPTTSFGAFISTVASPLAIGTVSLADGSAVHGFLCEPVGLQGATDITEHGGWRGYVATGLTRQN
jgi:allophanate hydrolase